ncbi:MAG: hypothetical protein GTO03_06670, partial [Planctomycetales bacterium]|nr:hypothetical protein [Planctomycetales bacterium]
PLLLSWAAFYEVYRAVQAGLPGEGPRARPVVSRRRYVVFHLRHYAGLLLVPVLVLV